MASRKRYTREFKLQAARLVVEQGYSYQETATRLGTSSKSIRNWVINCRAAGELPPLGSPTPEADELKRLRKENKRQQMEIDILKKAAAYFARESL